MTDRRQLIYGVVLLTALTVLFEVMIYFKIGAR